MGTRATTLRFLVLAAAMIVTATVARTASSSEAVPLREPLETLPLTLGDWRGRDRPQIDRETLGVLGVDDYVDRTYHRPGGDVGLYIGYYATQRQGDSVHSPMNCLPGTGWSPLDSGVLAIPVGDREITVRRVRVRRSADEALVLYWYQSRGRATASEYWSKAYLMLDAVRLNRSDTALVRVFSMVDRSADGVDDAERQTVAFVQALYPRLSRHLPD